MLHPLATLWRHSCRVTFFESGGALHCQLPEVGAGALSVRRRFRGQDEAVTYLRYWAGDSTAQADLRWIVQRLGASVAGSRQGPTPWLEPLAGLMVAGTLLVFEETARRAMPGRLVPPPSADAGASAALGSMAPLSSLPKTPAVPNLLPVLEDINVEGAEVLPELDQAMVQVKTTIASVSTAAKSLDPVDTKVKEIQDAMDIAAAKSAQGLNKA
jgi:hypothetical protein